MDPAGRVPSLSSLTDGRSPLIPDTIVIILIQGGYFLLSRRFLQSALPTLRQISKSPDSADSSDLVLGNGTASSAASPDFRATNVYVNASGGFSEPPSPSLRNNLALPGDPRRANLSGRPYDSDDSDAQSYAPSPAPSTPAEEIDMPLLPVYATGNARRQSPMPGRHEDEEDSLERKLGDVASGKKRVLRVFNRGRDRQRTEEAARSRVGRVTATRGLGWLATNLFSLLFSESLLLLTLVMFHAAGILHDRSRRVHFSFSLHLLLLLILFVVPWVQSMQLTYRAREPSSDPSAPSRRSLTISKRLIISLVPFSIYVFLLTRIPPYITTIEPPTLSSYNHSSLTWSKGFPSSIDLGSPDDVHEDEPAVPVFDETMSNQEGWQKGGWLEPSLGRVLACGVVVLGGLSGLGAVRTAWNFVETGGMTRGGRIITREDIISAERSLYRVRHELVAKRETLTARSGHGIDHDGNSTPPAYNPSWVGRVFGTAFGGDREANALRREVEGLEAIEHQISHSLEVMKLRRKRQNFARTLRGRIFNVIGYIFAAYCIARILICLTSVFFPPLATSRVAHDPITGRPVDRKGNTNGDWISFFIAWALSQLPNGFVDVNRASRAISLLLTGLLIMSSLAQVLRSVSRILRLTSKSIGAGFLLLGLGQLMATYAISLLIQLRSSLPPSMPEVDSTVYPPYNMTDGTTTAQHQPVHDPSLLSTLPDFRIFGRLFDTMFLLAAFGTAVYRYAGQKMNGADEFGHVYH